MLVGHRVGGDTGNMSDLGLLTLAEIAELRTRAHLFNRTGKVTAVLLEQACEWVNDNGSVLVGSPGDWFLDDGCRVWSAVDAAFRSSYVDDGDGRWRRVGQVQAVCLDRAVLVPTLEGNALATAGDWLCWYPHSDECWLVSPAMFTATPAV